MNTLVKSFLIVSALFLFIWGASSLLIISANKFGDIGIFAPIFIAMWLVLYFTGRKL